MSALDPKALDAAIQAALLCRSADVLSSRTTITYAIRAYLEAAPSGQATLEGVKPKSRLNQLGRMSKIWREVAEKGECGNEPLPQALDALDEAIWIAKAVRKASLLSPPASGAVEAGWQDIETAPKDGTRVELWHSSSDAKAGGWATHGSWRDWQPGIFSWRGAGGNLINATAWKPASAAPREDEEVTTRYNALFGVEGTPELMTVAVPQGQSIDLSNAAVRLWVKSITPKDWYLIGFARAGK